MNESLQNIIPTLLKDKNMKYYELKPDTENGQLLKSESPLTLGCVLSGGQAAGGHNVIMGMFDMVK